MQIFCTFVGKDIFIQYNVVSFGVGEEQIASFNHTLAALASSHSFHCGQATQVWGKRLMKILIASFLLVLNLF